MCCKVSAQSKFLASGSSDHTIKLWNIENGQELYSIIAHDDSIRKVGFSSDGNWLISSGWDNTTKVWNVEHNELLSVVENTSALSTLSDHYLITFNAYNRTPMFFEIIKKGQTTQKRKAKKKRLHYFLNLISYYLFILF